MKPRLPHKEDMPMPRFLTALALISLAPMPALADPLQDALAASQDGPLYTFDLTYRDSDIEALIQVDPSRPEGERLLVLSPDKSEWSEDLTKRIEDMQASTDGDIWCHNLAEHIPDDARLVSETDKTATYTFTPLPAEDADKNEKKVTKHLTGSVVVDKIDPAILSFRMASDKPFKPVAVAKIDDFDMQIACARAPDGRTHIARMDISLSGSAMMQAFSQSDHQAISNLQPIPNSGTGSK
ncbi:hypothetical protein [Hyphomonas pacifica]|uniref:Uncharacterized protein n=1 Tax=Hyphomonas pacifica TaxID=1280941 RepID=A0A062TVW0_9PROT|nr:hypothetical protein [Hyphomonas pacifica]KCZ52141.1 hypothetical protein HY2_09880 [Hyphomonas pacifica]RAN32255.1 hypothetical protein HY3_02715 [Hyphomonas pacifica]